MTSPSQQISALQRLINLTHQHAVALAARLRDLARLNAQRRAEIHKLTPKPPRPVKLTMYDSVDVAQIPHGAVAVAGYVNGLYANFDRLVTGFPSAKHLSISIDSTHDADCLDIETGDAVPADAPGWVRRQWKRGIARPVLYANRSTMPAVLQALRADGVPRARVRLWVADYTYQAHIPAGFDACQWTDKALGRNLDASQCSPTFFV